MVRVVRVVRVSTAPVSMTSVASTAALLSIVARETMAAEVRAAPVNAAGPMVPTCGVKAVLPVRRGPTCRRRCGR